MFNAISIHGYEEYSASTMAQFMGFGPNNAINLWPAELDDADTNKTSLLATFKQDESYTLKNAPLSSYVKYIIKQYSNGDLSIVSNNTTIDGKPATKLMGIMNDRPEFQTKQFVGWKIILYLTQHNDYSYSFGVFGDPKSFDKYSPEFEQIIKTINS